MIKENLIKELLSITKKEEKEDLNLPLSLKQNFIYTLFGNGFYNFSQWILIVILSKAATPNIVGKYVYTMAIVTPIFMFSNLRLDILQTTDIEGKFSYSNYFTFRLIFSFIAMILVFIILLLSKFNTYQSILIIIFALSKFAESLSDVTYGYMQKKERLDFQTRSLIFRSIYSIISFFICLILFKSLIMAILLQTLFWIFNFYLHDFRITTAYEEIKIKINFKIIRDIFLIGLPLGIITGLNSLNIQIPRYSLAHFVGLKELGIFGAISTLGYAGNLISLSLSRACLPRFAKLFHDNNIKKFTSLLIKLMLIGASIGFVGIFFSLILGKHILQWLYTYEYASHKYLLVLIMFYITIHMSFSFIGVAVSSTKSFNIQLLVHIIKIFAILISSIYLISLYGLIGAALSIIIGDFISGLMFSIILMTILRKKKKLFSF